MIESEMIATAVKTTLFIINTGCVCFICIFISKWLRRLEDKIDNLETFIEADIKRHSLAYVNLLIRLRDEAIQREDFKSAMKFQEIINKEAEREKE